MSRTSEKSTEGQPVAWTTRFEFMDSSQAQAELPRSIAVHLVGKVWADLVPSFSPVLRGGASEITRQGDRVIATVRVSNQILESWFKQFEHAQLFYQGPAQWRTSWLDALESERERWACRRREELLKVPCALAVDDANLRAKELIGALAARLVLEPNLPDGVPRAADGTLLWPVRVRVWQRTAEGLEPLSDVPVSVESDTGADLPSQVYFTDARGQTELQLPAGFAHATIRAFARSSLGPLAQYFPEVTTKVTTRSLDRARCVIVPWRPSVDAKFERAAHAHLRSATKIELVGLPEDLVGEIAHAEERVMPTALISRVVEATQGQVDYLAKVTVESEFASQMGNGRTWYEARAQVKVLEVWSGKVIDAFELTATEAGIGDQGADDAARERLASLVAARLRPPE